MAKKKIKQKTTRGEIAITARNGILYLRIPYQGKRRMLSTGYSDTSYHRIKANELKTRIEKDLVSDNFDETLEKYKVRKKADLPTVQLFNSFITYHLNQGTSENQITNRFNPLLNHLKRFGKDITTQEMAKEFISYLKQFQQAQTLNANLRLLIAFYQWADIEPNPFIDIAKAKGTKNRRKPYLKHEVLAILQGFNDSPYYKHYYPFVVALFTLGLRVSEAIGLRWGNIDLSAKKVTISESLSRSAKGQSSAKHRIRKSTKTGRARELEIDASLISFFDSFKPIACLPDDLVFPSPTGKAIDDHNFWRIWKKMLETLGIEHRPPYSSRHTFTSLLIDSGLPHTQVANVLGHTDTRMVNEVYGHALNRPVLTATTLIT